MVHICDGNQAITDSDNGLSPCRHQAIIWTNVGTLLIGPFGTNFSEISIQIHTFWFKKVHLKCPFCLSINVLISQPTSILYYAFPFKISFSLRWRHNGCHSVSNHQPRECLLRRLIRRTSKKISKLRVTGLCEGNSPDTGEFPAQMASNAENVSIWWRHHVNSINIWVPFQILWASVTQQWGHGAARIPQGPLFHPTTLFDSHSNRTVVLPIADSGQKCGYSVRRAKYNHHNNRFFKEASAIWDTNLVETRFLGETCNYSYIYAKRCENSVMIDSSLKYCLSMVYHWIIYTYI